MNSTHAELFSSCARRRKLRSKRDSVGEFGKGRPSPTNESEEDGDATDVPLTYGAQRRPSANLFDTEAAASTDFDEDPAMHEDKDVAIDKDKDLAMDEDENDIERSSFIIDVTAEEDYLSADKRGALISPLASRVKERVTIARKLRS